MQNDIHNESSVELQPSTFKKCVRHFKLPHQCKRIRRKHLLGKLQKKVYKSLIKTNMPTKMEMLV